MTEQDIARAAARKLGAEMPAGFPETVEAVLAMPDGGRDRFVDPTLLVSLASVLVSAATLGWTIYKDLCLKEGATPPKDALRRQIRLRLASDAAISEEKRDRIIEVVVDEISESNPV